MKITKVTVVLNTRKVPDDGELGGGVVDAERYEVMDDTEVVTPWTASAPQGSRKETAIRGAYSL